MVQDEKATYCFSGVLRDVNFRHGVKYSLSQASQDTLMWNYVHHSSLMELVCFSYINYIHVTKISICFVIYIYLFDLLCGVVMLECKPGRLKSGQC